MSENITVEGFIRLLWDSFNLPDSQFQLIPYGRAKGWLEDEDERFSKSQITRRTAARIVHQFVKVEKFIPDLSDISPAEELKDLYTCRVCANHIAQVYVRGIMTGQEIEYEGKIVKIFNQLEEVTEKQALEVVEKLKEIVTNFQRK